MALKCFFAPDCCAYSYNSMCMDKARYVNKFTGEPMCRYFAIAVPISEYVALHAERKEVSSSYEDLCNTIRRMSIKYKIKDEDTGELLLLTDWLRNARDTPLTLDEIVEEYLKKYEP